MNDLPHIRGPEEAQLQQQEDNGTGLSLHSRPLHPHPVASRGHSSHGTNRDGSRAAAGGNEHEQLMVRGIAVALSREEIRAAKPWRTQHGDFSSSPIPDSERGRLSRRWGTSGPFGPSHNHRPGVFSAPPGCTYVQRCACVGLKWSYGPRRGGSKYAPLRLVFFMPLLPPHLSYVDVCCTASP